MQLTKNYTLSQKKENASTPAKQNSGKKVPGFWALRFWILQKPEFQAVEGLHPNFHVSHLRIFYGYFANKAPSQRKLQYNVHG